MSKKSALLLTIAMASILVLPVHGFGRHKKHQPIPLPSIDEIMSFSKLDSRDLQAQIYLNSKFKHLNEDFLAYPEDRHLILAIEDQVLELQGMHVADRGYVAKFDALRVSLVCLWAREDFNNII
jgi:hypothetical protein